MMRGLKALHKALKKFSLAVQTVINIILLTVVYFISIGLTSLIAKRIFKKTFLAINKESRDSYWINEQSTTKQKNEYYRLF
ncbi:hypothetical protein HYV79_02705 [Candidatus Woesearchaeota archaeon]|nr:hypothetical protein [Candidatus Woesearchaeota archaeon]